MSGYEVGLNRIATALEKIAKEFKRYNDYLVRNEHRINIKPCNSNL